MTRAYQIPFDAPIVLNVAYGDLRKGVDLFVQIGARVMAEREGVRFVWVGDIEPALKAEVRNAVAETGLGERFVFVPFTRNLTPFYAAADLFALTSREDPFPTVLLQAIDAGAPAIAFEGAGGFEALGDAVVLVPPANVGAFASAIARLLDARKPQTRIAAGGFSMEQYATDLAALINWRSESAA
jgi:glycosyltransferase involved in cell wall biosynthesis